MSSLFKYKIQFAKNFDEALPLYTPNENVISEATSTGVAPSH